jgi:chromosome partitioning protein
MKTIAIISQNGGAGRSTLALHLAVAAESAGRPTIVFDLRSAGECLKTGEGLG